MRVRCLVLLSLLGLSPFGCAPRRCQPAAASDDIPRRLVWIDRAGRIEPLAMPARAYTYPRMAPNGAAVVVDIRGVDPGVWRSALGGHGCELTRLGEVGDFAPVWSANAQSVLVSRRRGRTGLMWIGTASVPDTARNTEIRLPVEVDGAPMPTALHPDAEHLVATRIAPSGFDIVSISMRTGAIEPLLASSVDELNGEISPDGRWLAYQSRASGQFDVWVRPWPSASGPGARLTQQGGTRPVWTRAGRELIVATNDGEILSIDTSALELDRVTGLPQGAGTPRRLFSADIFLEPVGRTFDVTSDGSWLLAIVAGGS